MWRALEISHWVRTRKKQRCGGCGRVWPAGTLMETWTGVQDGDVPERVYACLVCSRFWWETTDAVDVAFDELPDRDWYRYIQTEAKLALYTIKAGVTPMIARR